MVIIVTLLILFCIFFFVKRHSGPAHLAMIAGFSVYQLFGDQLFGLIHQYIPDFDTGLLSTILYLSLVAFFPLLLYFRSSRGGPGGLIRMFEAGIFAILLTVFISDNLSQLFPFDDLSYTLAATLQSIEGYIVLIGIASAYFDILVYHSHA